MLRILLSSTNKIPLCHPFQSIPVSYFSSHIFIKNKTRGTLNKIYQKPINLKAEKEKLLYGNQEPLAVDKNSFALPERPAKKSPKIQKNIESEEEVNEDQDNEQIESKWTTQAKETPTVSSDKAIESLESRAVLKEKELAIRFLKAKTKEDIYKLYEKSILQIKPLHISIAFFQVIKLTKMENKLKAVITKQSSSVRPGQPNGLWEDENFMALYKVALENIENMNPDSLIKLLGAIKFKKGHNEHLKIMYDQIIDWLMKDQNVLLFDRIQTVKLLVTFSKLAGKKHFYNTKNLPLYKLMSNKLKTEIKDLRTKNILQIYRACLKLKYFDPKLFTHLNAQIRKRIKYVYPKDLIACCAANIACKSQDSEAFTKSMLSHIHKADLIGNLRTKDLVNLLVLTYEALKLDFTPVFKEEINNIADRTIDRFMLEQRRYIAIQKQQEKTPQEGENNETKRLSLFYVNNFLRNLLLLERYDQAVIAFIQDILSEKCILAAKDILLIITYSLQVHKKTNFLKDSELEEILIPCFISLENNLTKISVEDLAIAHHILHTTLKDQKRIGQLCARSKDFTAKFQLLVRRFIHALIQANHALPWTTFMKEYSFFEQHSEIKISTSEFAALDFYGRSVRRNILQPLLVSAAEATEQQEQNESSIQLKLDERKRGGIVNNLWMLSAVMAKEYPIIENSTIFEEFAQVLQDQIQLKELTIDQLDKIIEIKSLFDNSLGQNPITHVLKTPEIEDIIIERFNTLQENALKRRKNLREELENLTKEIFGEENLTIKQNQVLPEDMLVDLLVTKNEKKYAVMLSSHAAEEDSIAKLEKVIAEDEKKILYSPIKEKVLEYKGYNPVFINVKEWINLDATQKKTHLQEFYKA